MVTQNAWNNQVTAAGVTFTGGTMSIGTDSTDNAINIGTAASAGRTTTVGNTTAASVLALKTGTGDFTLASATGTIISALDTGEITYPLQTAFLAYLASTVSNVTGNETTFTLGTTTALTEVFDQNSDFNTNGTLTAPVTGKYYLQGSAILSGCTVNTGCFIDVTTSNRTFEIGSPRTAAAANSACNTSLLADMDSGDTCTWVIIGTGEAAATDDVPGGSSPTFNYVSGHLVC